MSPDLGAWVEEHIPALGSGWRSGGWPGSGSVTRWADLRPSRRLCLRAAPRLRPAGQAVIRRSDLTAVLATWSSNADLRHPGRPGRSGLECRSALRTAVPGRRGNPSGGGIRESHDALARIGGRRSSRLDRLPIAAMPREREFDTKAPRPGWPFRRPTSPILVWDGATSGSGSPHVRLAMTPS